MKNRKSKSNLFTTILLILTFGIILPTTNCFSQNILVINERIGGGDSGTTEDNNGSDNVALFVIGAVLIGGFIAYSLLKNDTEKSDSSDSVDESSQIIRNNKFDSFNSKFQKAKDNIPVNLILGIKKEKTFISEKTYLVGVSVRF